VPHFLGRPWKVRITGVVLITGHGDWSRLGKIWLSTHDRMSDHPKSTGLGFIATLSALFLPFFAFSFPSSRAPLISISVGFPCVSPSIPTVSHGPLDNGEKGKHRLLHEYVFSWLIELDKNKNKNLIMGRLPGQHSPYGKIMGLHGTSDPNHLSSPLRD